MHVDCNVKYWIHHWYDMQILSVWGWEILEYNTERKKDDTNCI